MTKIRFFFVLLSALTAVTSCHLERYVVKSKQGLQKKKHVILTTTSSDRKLDIQVLEKDISPNNINFTEINFDSYPEHYMGFATIRDLEDNWILNLNFDSKLTQNDNLIIPGRFSINNKKDFEEVEIIIPTGETDTNNVIIEYFQDSLMIKGSLITRTTFDSNTIVKKWGFRTFTSV